MDRMTKGLFIVIAVFLGILVVRPYLKVTREATAQNATSTPTPNPPTITNNPMIKLAKVDFLARVPFDPDQSKPEVLVMDETHAIVVVYKDSFHVYKISDLRLPSLPVPSSSSRQ